MPHPSALRKSLLTTSQGAAAPVSEYENGNAHSSYHVAAFRMWPLLLFWIPRLGETRLMKDGFEILAYALARGCPTSLSLEDLDRFHLAY